ncbi:LOW QUALITY PROTEIN: LigA protein, partial [Kutzneria sp. 744]
GCGRSWPRNPPAGTRWSSSTSSRRSSPSASTRRSGCRHHRPHARGRRAVQPRPARVGVRADFFGHCLQYPQLRQVLGEGPVLVGAMTSDELRLAITKPAIDLGYTVETALVTRLVAEVTNQPGVLPLMSHALLETWRRRQGITLTAAGYDAAGGISHALSRTAESVYSGLTEAQQAVARQVFLRLTALGDGTEDTRRRVDRTELEHVEGLDEVLDALVAARLITVDRDSVDIAHEALISHWPRLREWLTEDRDSLRVHRQLTEAAEIWDGLTRDDGALYRGARLQLARDWVRSCTPSLSHREQAFYDRSVSVREQELLSAQRQTRRQRRFIALLVVLLVALSGTTAYSLISQQTVARQRDEAVVRNVIDQISTTALSDPRGAAKLALAAYRSEPSPRTRGLVLSSFTNSLQYASAGQSDFAESLDVALKRHAYAQGDAVEVEELRPVGGSSEWAKLPRPPEVTGKITFCVLSPDGRRVAVVYAASESANTVSLWDVASMAHPQMLRIYRTDAAVGVAFSPDGRLLAIGSLGATEIDHQTGGKTGHGPDDQRTFLWDTTNAAAAEPLAVLPISPSAMQFSADGRTLVTAPVAVPAPAGHKSWEPDIIAAPAKVWDVPQILSGKPAKPIDLDGVDLHDAAAVSPDGRLIAVAHREGQDGYVTLWRRTPEGAITKIRDVATAIAPALPVFSADGRYLATAEGDNTVVLRDVSDPTRPVDYAVLPGPETGAHVLAFGTENRIAAAAGTVLIRGLDVDLAAKEICTPPRVMGPGEHGGFPSPDLPDPCPSGG